MQCFICYLKIICCSVSNRNIEKYMHTLLSRIHKETETESQKTVDF